jgi:DNA-nicking Smr family endonuclease
LEEPPHELPIDGTLDLHAFAPRDVVRAVEAYIDACRAQGVVHLRLIHGKGKGVQRAAVQRIVSRHPAVRSFRTADESGGGWGATLVDLLPP